MSGLAGLIAGHHRPGVYLWHNAAEPADVEHTVVHAGWHYGYVDGWTHQDKDAFLAAVGEALAFPDYYGKNLDALNDCLYDVPADTVLLWDGWGPLAREDERTFRILVDIFGDHADDGLSVLLRGAGPAVAVQDLDG